MKTYQEQILTIRAQTLAIITEITESPKPTYNVENQSVSWGSYLAQLQETVAWCNMQLKEQETAEPYEFHTTAGT